jgi:hypothetical protein
MRSGGPSPAGWGRWADGGHAGPRWRGVVQLARRSRRRVDSGTLQGESAIMPGFALLSLTRAQRGTNGRVCSGELWVERLTNDDGFDGCQQRRPLLSEGGYVER